MHNINSNFKKIFLLADKNGKLIKENFIRRFAINIRNFAIIASFKLIDLPYQNHFLVGNAFSISETDIILLFAKDDQNVVNILSHAAFARDAELGISCAESVTSYATSIINSVETALNKCTVFVLSETALSFSNNIIFTQILDLNTILSAISQPSFHRTPQALTRSQPPCLQSPNQKRLKRQWDKWAYEGGCYPYDYQKFNPFSLKESEQFNL